MPKKMTKWIGSALMVFMFALPLTVTFQRADTGNQASIDLADFRLSTQYAQADEQAPAEQVEAPAPVADESADPTWFDKILGFIAGSGGLIAALGIGLEVLFRLIPSKKPLSILRPARYACVSLATIFTFLGNLLTIALNAAQNSQQGLPQAKVEVKKY